MDKLKKDQLRRPIKFTPAEEERIEKEIEAYRAQVREAAIQSEINNRLFEESRRTSNNW